MFYDRFSLNTFDAVEHGNYVWFSNLSFNGLFRTHIRTRETEFVQFFPNESVLAQQLHLKCFLYENHIIFLPWASNKIQIYDIASENMSTLLLDCSKAYISGVIQKDDILLLFPFFKSGHLYKMDMNTLEISKCEVFNHSVNDWVSDDRSILSYNYVCHDNHVMFAISETKNIGVWDLSTDSLAVEQIKSARISVLSLYNGRLFASITTDSKLYEINMAIHSEKIIGGNCNSLKKHGSPVPYEWYCVDECNDKLLVYPWNADGIYEIVNNKLEKRLNISEFDFSDTLIDYPVFMGWLTIDNEIWLLPCRLRELLICNSNMSEIESIQLCCKETRVKRIINNELVKQRIKDSGNILFENPELGLDDYLNAVVSE